MNKKLSIATSALALTLGFSVHAEEDGNWYLGAQYSTQEITSYFDRKFEVVGVTGGYQFNKYLSLEARYNPGTSVYSRPYDDPELEQLNAKFKEDMDYQASLFVKASYPIFSSFSIYGLAGVTKSKYEVTAASVVTDAQGNTTVEYPRSMKFSENGFTYGAGLNYKLTESVALSIDYQVLPDRDFENSSGDWESMNFGVNYVF